MPLIVIPDDEPAAMSPSRAFRKLAASSAFFINTARGAVVDEADLVHALHAAGIADAGLDVYDHEPLPAASPFFSLPNVMLMPHATGMTPATTEAGLVLAIENVFSFLADEAANVVV